MARTYNDIYYNDDENSTAEILDDMKKLAESVDQQIGSIKSFNNDTSQFIEQVTPLMNTLSEQVIDMHQLADTMFTELEQVKEENKQLRQDLNGLPKGQASGESIDLNDSAEMRCELKISGNSKQETRSGKNYLNTFAKYKAGDTVTIEGITYIFNNDGSITCNGTATANSILDISQNIQTISGTNKKIIGFLTGSQVPSKIALVSYTRNYDTSTYLTFSEVNKSLQSKMKENKNYTLFRITVYSGTTVNNQTVYYQILDTSETDLTYEQYGVSPSPDYPSEVESCGDNINIFDGEVEEGNIDASTGQNTAVTNAWRSKNYLNVKDTSVSISVKDLTFSGTVGRLYFYKSDNTYISNILINSLPFTATLPNETAKVRFFILNSVADINAKIKLEKGSTVTPYSPYGQGCINEVICNKNLFNLNDYLLNMSIYSDGSIKFGQDNNLYYIPVQYGKKYIMSLNTTLATNCVYGYTNEFPSTSVKSTYNVLNISNLNNHIFEPTDPDNKYLCIRINYVSQLPQMANIQLEEGQTATEYVEHKSQTYTIPTQQPMRAIGNVRDKFILKENGKWYERHPIFRKIFTGNETFTLQSINDYGIANFDYKTGNTGYQVNGNILCNRFITQTAGISSIKTDGIYMNRGDVIFIRILASEIDTVEKLKTWLATLYTNGTPVYVDYVLKEPLDIECTEEQSTILDQIENEAKTYKNVTHIYSTDEISPVIDVTYKKDIETLFANTLVEGV